jgi:hypothetical protein
MQARQEPLGFGGAALPAPAGDVDDDAFALLLNADTAVDGRFRH